jgi:aryl-alcohol dehydrogenase-like predicted oxidoreductase
VIDLYYLHFPDPHMPVEDTAGAVADLIGEGLVRQFGLWNVTADELRRAHAIQPVTAVQVEWSTWKPILPDLLAAADELGVGIVAWSPLGGGFLTGTVTNLGDADFRNNAPRFQAEILAVNNDRHAAVRRLAASLAITPGQRALAWLLHQHRAVVSIPGSRTAAHIDENIEWPASISIPTRSTRSTACSPTPSPPAPRCCDGRYGGHRQPDRGRRDEGQRLPPPVAPGRRAR